METNYFQIRIWIVNILTNSPSHRHIRKFFWKMFLQLSSKQCNEDLFLYKQWIWIAATVFCKAKDSLFGPFIVYYVLLLSWQKCGKYFRKIPYTIHAYKDQPYIMSAFLSTFSGLSALIQFWTSVKNRFFNPPTQSFCRLNIRMVP